MYATPDAQPGTDDYFDINKFEQLLQRLEGSKGRQQRQKSLEGRRDIYAQGLASMMSNLASAACVSGGRRRRSAKRSSFVKGAYARASGMR